MPPLKIKLLVFVIALVITASCRKDVLYLDDTHVYECTNFTPRYQEDVVPIITTYCTASTNGSCHQPMSGHLNLTSYDTLKFLVDWGHIKDHCIKNREMPPSYSKGPKKIPLDTLRILNCWMECGAPDN